MTHQISWILGIPFFTTDMAGAGGSRGVEALYLSVFSPFLTKRGVGSGWIAMIYVTRKDAVYMGGNHPQIILYFTLFQMGEKIWLSQMGGKKSGHKRTMRKIGA